MKRLINGFFLDFAGVSSFQPSSNGRPSRAVLSTMRRVVEELIEKHQTLFNELVDRHDELEDEQEGDDSTSFMMDSVAESIFTDDTTDWERVAGLLAFGAFVCRRLVREPGLEGWELREQCVGLLSQEVCTYLLHRHGEWMAENNYSWDGFVEFFGESELEPESCRTLTLIVNLRSRAMLTAVAAAGLAGISGMGLILMALMIVRR